MTPRFPLYIPSKGRAALATTPRALERLGVPYRLVVEESQYGEYAEHHPSDRLLILDPAFQERYDTCDDRGSALSKGPGPARNFIWEHSMREGWPWHWVLDDNIRFFARFFDNQRIRVADGTIFHAMETFGLRYSNVGMLGPNYWMFVLSREKMPPFGISRIYSCNLIRNDLPYRWRGRWNEDTILSLDLLKAGWACVLFNAFLQWKLHTQAMPGGNTEDFYREYGTLEKSKMLVREHPDVASVVWRYGRWHHYVDYSDYRRMRLIPDPTFTEQPVYNFKLTKDLH